MKRLFSILISFAICFGSLCSVSCFAQENDRCILYVSTAGKDTNAGTFEKPLATLNGARDKIREIRKSGKEYSKGYVVYVRGGVYNCIESFELSQEDSGTENAPVIYRNYMDEKVTLVGGLQINGADFSKIEDATVRNRIIESSARDKVYMYDLKKLGITDIGEPYLPGAYSYLKPASDPKYVNVISGGTPSSEVFFNGESLTIARYPNNDYCYITSEVDDGFVNGREEGAPFGTHFKFTFQDERIKAWAKAPADSILMYGFWKYDWADSTHPIHSIDVNTYEIESGSSTMFGIEGNKHFYVFNLLEEIDSPGEYYVDRGTSTLYLYPPSDLKTANITYSLLEDNLIKLTNASNIQIKNINMTATRNNTVVISGGKNNVVSGCEIYNSASYAAIISGTNNGITNCHIHDTNAGVRLLGGDFNTITPGHCYATNNHFEKFSRITKTYTPAIQIGGVENIAAYNEIHNAPHMAIGFEGVKQQIMYNNIYDVVNDGDDSAAIYGGLDWVGRAHEIRYNYIHDLGSTSKANAGIGAIYLDGGQCEVYMVGNVFEDIIGRAVWINGGRDNVTLNNVMVDCKEGFYLNEAMIEVMEAGNLEVNHITRVNAATYTQTPLWRETFPKFDAMMNMSIEERCEPGGNVCANNVMYNVKAPTRLEGRATSMIDTSVNYIANSDPGFYDLKKENYTLKSDSSVYSELEDFRPIPFTRMGKIDDRAITRVQDSVVMLIDSPYSLANGIKTAIDPENDTVVPTLVDDTTYVPIRFLAETLGATVNYDGETNNVTISSPVVSLEISLSTGEAKKNGEPVTLSKRPLVMNNRTMVPLRAISELFEKSVYWYKNGFICISDDENIFLDEDSFDNELIKYLSDSISIY